jgi:hypothetical protein
MAVPKRNCLWQSYSNRNLRAWRAPSTNTRSPTWKTVILPQPEGPGRVRNFPDCTCGLILNCTVFAPYALKKFHNSMTKLLVFENLLNSGYGKMNGARMMISPDLHPVRRAWL